MSATTVLGQRLGLTKPERIRYEELTLLKSLGSGGFGSVYSGLYKGHKVAIKKLHLEKGIVTEEQIRDLEAEILAFRDLRHERLVAFYGACLRHPNYCIVTELMEGGSLHDLLHEKKRPLPFRTQWNIAKQTCEGVVFLHACTPTVVHRDLKSLNIVLDRDLNAKLCDFGLTTSMERTHISLKDGMGGSPRYMAPECYDSSTSRITEKVDIWALGCIVIEIFGGPLPFSHCTSIQQIMTSLLLKKEPPVVPHFLPPNIRQIIKRCFEFDPAKRPTAREVSQSLEQRGGLLS